MKFPGRHNIRSLLILPGILIGATGNLLAGEAAPENTVSGSITLANDYIWRGQSQTWGKPALQFGLEGSHASGLYAGVWASNVSNQWVPGTHLETDWYAGIRNKFPGALSDFGYDLNLLYVYYPGGDFDKTGFRPRLDSSSPNTVEVSFGLSYKWLSVKAGQTLTKFYGWNPNNSGLNGGFAGDLNAGVTGNTRGSHYVEANGNYEISDGWVINGQLGAQTIAHSQGLDWTYYKLGVIKNFSTGWSANLFYSGSSKPDAFKGFVGLTNNGAKTTIAESKILYSLSYNF